jgi:prevent-host-death family protein
MSATAPEQTIASTTFARNLGEYLDAVRDGETTLIVHAHGRRQIVLLPMKEYDELRAAERELKRLRAANGGQEA